MSGKFLFSILIAAALALPVSAHVGGFTFETMVDDHFIDIGASTLTFQAGEPALFDFNLYPNTDPNRQADFDSVYVTVGDDDQVLLSTFVHRPGESLTVLSYVFPRGGEYEVSARYQKGEQVLAQSSFPVQVQKAKDWYLCYAWPLGGVLGGILLAAAFRKWRGRPARPAV